MRHPSESLVTNVSRKGTVLLVSVFVVKLTNCEKGNFLPSFSSVVKLSVLIEQITYRSGKVTGEQKYHLSAKTGNTVVW